MVINFAQKIIRKSNKYNYVTFQKKESCRKGSFFKKGKLWGWWDWHLDFKLAVVRSLARLVRWFSCDWQKTEPRWIQNLSILGIYLTRIQPCIRKTSRPINIRDGLRIYTRHKTNLLLSCSFTLFYFSHLGQ